VADKLTTYRRMRDARRTPEPVPSDGPLPQGNDDTFVIQEHHARRLHWDVRLERGGVLVSWAVPRGLPLDPATNHLAVHTEDHPLEYASFEGVIPRGEYGGGKMILWDRGRYVVEKWTDREVKVVLDGTRARGRYVFFRVRDRDWMVHRMDPPPTPDWRPMPEHVVPMRPVAGPLPDPAEDGGWAYEMNWGGARAVVFVDGGRARVDDAGGDDITSRYPELRALGPELGSTVCVLDGEIVVLDGGRPSGARLRERASTQTSAQIRRLSTGAPVTYLVFDLLHLDRTDTVDLSYTERRELLDRLSLRGSHWDTSPSFDGGAAALQASRDLGLDGIVAKRRDAPYEVGRRSPAWREVSGRPTLDVVIGGWTPGRDPGLPGALLVGVATDDGVAYAGMVRSGLSAAVKGTLAPRMRRLARKTSPFTGQAPTPADAQWVRPVLTADVSHDGWTSDGRLRRPTLLRIH